MQSVSAAFTAEERDSVRSIASSLLVSWKKETITNPRAFTIGVSLIGGSDGTGINPSAIGGPSNYRYFDESDYLLSLAWERGLNMPMGGLSMALAEAKLDNTSGRFTPRYMGGNSELFTAILPRRPIIINAGFDFAGIDQTIPQFVGVLNKPPEVNKRSAIVRIEAGDYVDFFHNRYLDKDEMFTAKRTDQIIETVFQNLGLSTAQYELDPGINIVPFALFEKGTRYANMINDLVQAENGHMYQDEMGIFRFENRQHWDSSPHTSISSILMTGQVIDSETIGDDHLINVVEIDASPRVKQEQQAVFKLGEPIAGTAGERIEVFVSFDDPVMNVQAPLLSANTAEDGSGTSITPTLVSSDIFAQAAKYIITLPTSGYLTGLDVYARPARVVNEIYFRAQDDSSLTAYEERPVKISNNYIQDYSWANSYAHMILDQFSSPENIVRLTIRAVPSLQMGDLISWQGRYWRVFDIKTKLDPSEGFIQTITILQRTIVGYFRIGISTIGGTDRIAA